MVRRATSAWSAGLVLVAAGLPGCSPHFTHNFASPAKPAPVLTTTPRVPIDPDVSGLPLEVTGVPPARPLKYRQLTATECRVLAIKNAPFADDLDRHPDNAAPPHPHVRQRKAEKARIEALVRGHAADESRNRAAGEALDQFFQLAKAEGQFDLLTAAHAELRQQLDQAVKAQEQGLRDRAGIDEIRVQLLNLQRADGPARSRDRAVERFPPCPTRVRTERPASDLAERPASGSPRRTRREPGGGQRAALPAGLKPASGAGDRGGPGADDVRQQVLSGVNPLLAVAARASPPLAAATEAWTHEREKNEAAARRTVSAVLAARERQAEAEIRAAVLDLHGIRPPRPPPPPRSAGKPPGWPSWRSGRRPGSR